MALFWLFPKFRDHSGQWVPARLLSFRTGWGKQCHTTSIQALSWNWQLVAILRVARLGIGFSMLPLKHDSTSWHRFSEYPKMKARIVEMFVVKPVAFGAHAENWWNDVKCRNSFRGYGSTVLSMVASFVLPANIFAWYCRYRNYEYIYILFYYIMNMYML